MSLIVSRAPIADPRDEMDARSEMRGEVDEVVADIPSPLTIINVIKIENPRHKGTAAKVIADMTRPRKISPFLPYRSEIDPIRGLDKVIVRS